MYPSNLHPGHTRLTGSFDKLLFGLLNRSATTDRNNKRILAAERLYKCLRLIVIDFLRRYAFQQRTLAISPRDSRNSVFARLKQGFRYEAAGVAAYLYSFVSR